MKPKYKVIEHMTIGQLETLYLGVRNIGINPEWTHLYPKWWHRLFFWRKYKYPEFVKKRIYTTLQNLKNK